MSKATKIKVDSGKGRDRPRVNKPSTLWNFRMNRKITCILAEKFAGINSAAVDRLLMPFSWGPSFRAVIRLQIRGPSPLVAFEICSLLGTNTSNT